VGVGRKNACWRHNKSRFGDSNESRFSTRFKRFLDLQKGNPVGDLWTDIQASVITCAERLGYPTAEPLTLLRRIIWHSSNKGIVVLDPSCGCGTAIHAAQEFDRRWIGIDVKRTLPFNIVEQRLKKAFPATPYSVYGRSKGH